MIQNKEILENPEDIEYINKILDPQEYSKHINEAVKDKDFFEEVIENTNEIINKIEGNYLGEDIINKLYSFFSRDIKNCITPKKDKEKYIEKNLKKNIGLKDIIDLKCENIVESLKNLINNKDSIIDKISKNELSKKEINKIYYNLKSYNIFFLKEKTKKQRKIENNKKKNAIKNLAIELIKYIYYEYPLKNKIFLWKLRKGIYYNNYNYNNNNKF